MSVTSLSSKLEAICQGMHLNTQQSQLHFNHLISGDYSAIEIASFLTALKAKGETIDEITGAVNALRNKALPFPDALPLNKAYTIVDCVGTGGDGHQTLNISSACAILLSCAGVKVAKHGNRSVSSRCGSADLFEGVGLKLEISPHLAKRSLEEVGLCFLYAPYYHPAMKLVREVRNNLKIRTIFNIIGPLLNPLQPDYQLMGVYDPNLCYPLAQVLKKIHVRRALVVHGEGLDELAIHGSTTGVLLRDGEITEFCLTPEEVGLKRYPLEAIKGGDIAHNVQCFVDLLQGKGLAAYRDSVALNAGATLWMLDKVPSIIEGVTLIQELLDSSKGYCQLQKLIEVSHAS